MIVFTHRTGTFLEDLRGVIDDIGGTTYGGSIVYAALFLLFVLLAALTVMNLLIGVLCTVVSTVAATEKEQMIVSFVIEKMQGVIDEIDSDKNHRISKEEFVKIMDHKVAVKALHDVGVDCGALVALTDIIFQQPGEGDKSVELTFKDFMEAVLRFRGSNTATVKDVVELRRYFAETLRSELRRVPQGKDLRGKTFERTVSSGPTSEPHGRAAGCGIVTELRFHFGRLEAFLLAGHQELWRLTRHCEMCKEEEEGRLALQVNEFLVVNAAREIARLREALANTSDLPEEHSARLLSCLSHIERYVLGTLHPKLLSAQRNETFEKASAWASACEFVGELLKELGTLRPALP